MRTDMARIDALDAALTGELVVVKNALGHAVEQALAAGLEKQHRPESCTKCCTANSIRLTADLSACFRSGAGSAAAPGVPTVPPAGPGNGGQLE